MNDPATPPSDNTWIFKRIVDSTWFTSFIVGVIVFAGILVGVETFPELAAKHAGLIALLNNIVLAIFTLEVALKITAEKKHPWRYFTDGWNLFDFTIVAVCFLPLGGSYVAVLRLFRLLRVIRLVTVIPKLQLLVTALLRSLPSMFYVCLLLFLLFYVYAVIGVMLFSGNDPVHFGNLWTSFLTLFRIVTLEDWTDVMYLQMYGSDIYQGYNLAVAELATTPRAMPVISVVYFVSFVLLGTMVMLNLVIGVIINGMDDAQKELADRKIHRLLTESSSSNSSREDKVDKLKKQLEAISKELSELA
ncbi:ion transporter [Coraliomargarita akajimensis]|uniref:Ion transport protein n=1 Tax=Coraliomargarita akajimensis (strain DSM 45221 / IAM 15411 / JCM 23193 / KCTC 12865 / 04OKA010-24) TaxID=583355 RepID=D5EPU7_CORAD|nr:ion transporter [Coraliomargarita akajimensis]ADE55680.1 Ion transport protein [Coraliomargarita akajimensis DSM 45221]